MKQMTLVVRGVGRLSIIPYYKLGWIDFDQDSTKIVAHKLNQRQHNCDNMHSFQYITIDKHENTEADPACEFTNKQSSK